MTKPTLLVALFALSAVFLGLKASHAQTSMTISLTAKHLIYAPDLDRLLVSVPDSTALPGGGILAINPATGTITKTLVVPGGPDILAISQDGKFLYTSLDNTPAVDRVDLRTWKSDLQFSLGTGSVVDTPDYAIGLAVLPDNPHAVAVARGNGPYPASFPDGIAIYDDGVQRPETTAADRYLFLTSLAFGATSSVLYGENVVDSGQDFAVLDVTSKGVTIANTIPNFMTGNLMFRGATHRLYSGSGLVSDPNTLERKGQFFAPDTYTYPIKVEQWDGVPDLPRHRFFSLTTGATITPTDATLISYDTDTYRPLGLFTIPNANSYGTIFGGVNSLVMCGTDRLAFQNISGQIFIVSGLDFAGLKSLSLTPSGPIHAGTVDAIITLSRPAPVNGAPVLLTGSAFGMDSATPVIIPAGRRSMSFSLTIPPITTPRSGVLTAQYGLQTTGIRADFVSGPNSSALPPNIKTLYALTSSFAYDPQVNRVFATLPSADTQHGNSIIRIDPNTAQIEGSLEVGSEPDKITVSSNGEYLYAGLQGAGSVSRVNVREDRLDLMFYIGNDPADGPYLITSVAPLPGLPRSVAIGRENEYDTGTVVGPCVYDDDAARPAVPFQRLYVDTIAFGDDASHLYGVDSQTSDAGFSRYSVNQDGVSLIDDTPYFVQGWKIKYDAGRMFTEEGMVFDPLTNTTIATLPIDPAGYYQSSFTTDVAHERAYYFVTDLFSRTSALKIFDTSTYMLVSQYTLPSNFTNPDPASTPGAYGNLILCGQDKLAFENADGQMAFINVAPARLASITSATHIVRSTASLPLLIALTNVADVSGSNVVLTSSNPSIASVPTNVTVQSNKINATVSLSVGQVSAPTRIIITARMGATMRRLPIIVTP